MSQYHTKQREVLLHYLNEHAHAALTAHEIAAALACQDISRSAVYRNLASLVKEGTLRKIAQDNSREAAYQYVAADCCQGKLHLTCKSCGKTIHLPQDETMLLINFLLKAERFSMTPAETILYGKCENCQ